MEMRLLSSFALRASAAFFIAFGVNHFWMHGQGRLKKGCVGYILSVPYSRGTVLHELHASTHVVDLTIKSACPVRETMFDSRKERSSGGGEVPGSGWEEGSVGGEVPGRCEA